MNLCPDGLANCAFEVVSALFPVIFIAVLFEILDHRGGDK